MNNDLIWVESFRPHTLDECILPERIKTRFRKMIESGTIQNYAAVGGPGSGKTSSARAMCEELGIEYIMINMSNESGIDTVRNKIVNFASSMSFTSSYKVIILDEFDHANKNSAQPALRGIIEEFQQNCRFIITANFQNKIIEPLFSRCPIISFDFTQDERTEILTQFIKRIQSILNENAIAYDLKELITFCKSYFPDLRQILNTLQLNSANGELQFSSLGVTSTEKIDSLIAVLKKKEFWPVKEWVTNNAQGNDGHLIRRAIYNNLKEHIKGHSVADAVLLINQYDYREAHVVDKEINMVSFLLELMMAVEFN